MRKLGIGVAALAATTILLAGCSGGGNTAGSVGEPTRSRSTPAA